MSYEVKSRLQPAEYNVMAFGEIHPPLLVTLGDQGHRCGECFKEVEEADAFLAPEDRRMWVCSGCYVKLLPDAES